MWIRIWTAIKISMTIIGTTVGAGFASGREIWEFFGSYGDKSHWAIILAMVLFFVASVVILWISWRYKTNNYLDLLKHLMGKRLTIVFDLSIALFLLTTTIVMLAGSGEIFKQWDRSFLEGCLVLGLAVIVVIFFDLKGIFSINTVLSPVLGGVLIYVCCSFLWEPSSTHYWDAHHSVMPAWPSAIAYAAFNIISLVAVLSSFGKSIKHSSEIWLSGLISFFILTVLSLLYNMSLIRVEHLLSQYEIPLFAIVQNVSPLLFLLISIVLWLSIYTTTISGLYGFISRVSPYIPLPNWLLCTLLLAILTPMSQFGFSALISWLYPLYGVLNLFLLAVILLYPLTAKRE